MANTSTSLSMYQKGAVHLLLPILVLLGAGILVGSNITTTEKFPDDPNVQGVLVAKGDDNSGSGSSGSSGSDNNSSGSSGSSGSGSGSNRGSSEKHRNSENSGRGNQDNATSTQENVNRGPSENSNQGGKVKIEIREGVVVSETEIEDEDEEIEDDTDEEEDEEEEEEATPSASPNHQLENRIRSIAKFPLRIDLSTNQLIMTKNGVERVLTVLPEQAVQNMLRAHLKKGLGPKFFGILTPSASPSASPEASPSASPEASPSATPEATASPEPEATESAEITVLESQIQLEERGGKPVYKIPALKHLRVLGLIPVTTQFTAYVSAETGNLLEEQRSLLSRILDLLSP